MKSFSSPQINKTQALNALDTAAAIVTANLSAFSGKCQNHSSVNNIYPPCENNQWTCGFWPGEIWLSYEHTGADSLLKEGQALTDSFMHRIINKIETDHHDMGFLYSPSCIADFKLTGSTTGKKAAILAADALISRFQEKGEFIQAWGKMGESDNYRYIIDCLLNLPLLYWASEETGDDKYAIIAHKHIDTCLENSIRADGSTYHTFFMDMDTGKPKGGRTCQGYSDDSFWARGQAWAIYGIALSYRYTQREEYKAVFDNVLQYYLSRLPTDLIPYWDMIFTHGDEPRDSSSAAITACGLLEMAKHTNEDKAQQYTTLALQMMKSLVDNYAVTDFTQGTGLLLHGTYSKKSPYNTCTPEGVDECVSWGDYFYMEALTRLTKDWEMYW